MRWMTIAVVVFLAAQRGLAQPGGYQLFSKEGKELTPAGAMVCVVPWDIVGQTVADKQVPVDLKNLIARTVVDCEHIARVAPPDGATTTQLETFARKKQDDLKKVVDGARAAFVFESVHVLDVIELPKPAHRKYLVFGEVDWTSQTVVSDTDAITVQHLEAERTARNPDVPRSEIDQRIAVVKQGAETRKPVQMVYCLTNDESVAKWKRDSRQNIRGYVQTVAAFVYPQAKESKSDEAVRSAYVGLEFIVVEVR
jgi:hypothetical protein